jgi:hypothetical protein
MPQETTLANDSRPDPQYREPEDAVARRHKKALRETTTAPSAPQPKPPATGPPDEKLLTAEQGIAFLNERGIPISLSTFEKLDSPAIGDGPPVDFWWGKRKLRRGDTLLKWAQARLSSERRSSPHNWPAKAAKAPKAGRAKRSSARA